MQKNKSKSRPKVQRQSPARIVDASHPAPLLGEVNLNQIEVEALVREEERLLQLMGAQQGDATVDSQLDNLSTVLLQALHTKDQQLVDYALEKDVLVAQPRTRHSSRPPCGTCCPRRCLRCWGRCPRRFCGSPRTRTST